jgi:hypothetical protein
MSDQQGKGSIVYKLVIVLLVVILVFVIIIPGTIWTHESETMEKSRTNMVTLHEAYSYYHQLTGQYTTDQDELITTVKNDSALRLRLEIVNHTNRLKDAIENFLNSSLVSNMYLISSNISKTEEDFDSNRRYFRSQESEIVEKNILNKAEDLQLQLSTFRSGVEYENYRTVINAIDSLWQLRRDLTDYSLQAAARRAGNLAETITNHMPDIDFRALNNTWSPLSARIANFLDVVNSIEKLKMQTTIADRVSDFQDEIATGFATILKLNKQSALNEARRAGEEINRVYQEFLSDFLVTEKYAQHRLSETDSLLLLLSDDNFYTPESKKPYLVSFDDSAGVTIEDPTLLSELRNRTNSSVQIIKELPFMSGYLSYMEQLDALQDFYLQVKTRYRRNLEVTIKTKELDEVISKIKDAPSLRAYTAFQDFVNIVPNSNSFTEIKDQIESALINTGIFKQIFQKHLFGQFDTLHVQIIDHLSDFNNVVSQIRRNTYSFNEFIDALNTTHNQITSIPSQSVLSNFNEIEKNLTDDFVFASEGREKNVYGLFTTKIENYGKVFGKTGQKSWEEPE